MKSRRKIEVACEEAGFSIVELKYVREWVAVPEEVVPVGWYLLAQVSDEEGDTMEFTGSVDDVISSIEWNAKTLV